MLDSYVNAKARKRISGNSKAIHPEWEKTTSNKEDRMRDLVTKTTRIMPKTWGNQRGITGLETAIVLIAFVVVSSVFAFAALSTGLFSSDKSKETINAGLSEARGTLEVRGSVIAKESTTGDTIDELIFQVANAAGGEAVDMTPGETLIVYSDADQSVTLDSTATTGGFTVTALGSADSDKLVEPGEMYEVKVIGLFAKLNPDLGTDKLFTLEVKPPSGAVVNIGRRTPVVIEKINDLG